MKRAIALHRASEQCQKKPRVTQPSKPAEAEWGPVKFWGGAPTLRIAWTYGSEGSKSNTPGSQPILQKLSFILIYVHVHIIKNMYVLYSLYTCLMPYPLQFDHSYMGVRTRVAHPNQSVSFWLFTSTAVGPTLWPQLCAMTAELNARRAILEDLNLDHVLCVWCGIYKHFIKYVYRFCWNFVEYIGYANGGFKAKVCTYLQYVPIQKTCDGHVSLFHNHLSQDFLNSYFTVRAESIRNSATHEVLSVPKEGPCSAEMVSWHRKIL